MFDPDNTPTEWQQVPVRDLNRTANALQKATSIAKSHKHHVAANSDPESYEGITVVAQLEQDIHEMEDCREAILNPDCTGLHVENTNPIQTL